LNVTFTNTSSTNVVSVIWNFGDTLSGANNTSTLFDPSHVYAQEGTYTVTLVGVDANGCTDTVTGTIEVTGQSALFIPNVFTPGGQNPAFAVSGVGITEYNIQIFDRWGLKLFESGSINDPWTGDNSNDGAYFYLIKAKGIEGKEYDEKGYLQLIRGK
jgi:PKD repeat protein